MAQFNFEIFAGTLHRNEMPQAYPVEAAPTVDEEAKTYWSTKAIQDTTFKLTRARTDMTADERWKASAAVMEQAAHKKHTRTARQIFKKKSKIRGSCPRAPAKHRCTSRETGQTDRRIESDCDGDQTQDRQKHLMSRDGSGNFCGRTSATEL